jgi:ABC-type multidrug transport system fused ATPase/permease subunit
VLSLILQILDREGRRQYFALAILSVLSSLLQAAGVAAISLFFTVLLGGQLPALVQNVTGELSFASLGLVVLAFTISGTLSSAAATYWGIRTSWRQYHKLASRLLERFVTNSYEWHLQQNTASLAQAVITEVYAIVSAILQQMVMVLVRGAEVLLIAVLLVAIRPKIALVAVLSFGILYALLYRANKGSIALHGERVVESNAARQRAVNEALGGIKSVKVSRMEGFFLNNFNRSAATLGDAMSKIQYFSLMPKYFIEILLFGGLIGFLTVSHARGWSNSESVPLLALYGAAAIRLLPAVQQLYFSLAAITASKASLVTVLAALQEDAVAVSSDPIEVVADGPLVALQDVSYAYPGCATPSLSNVDLEIRPGEKVGIVGATGAGKTTLVDIVLGLLPPSHGRISRVTRHSDTLVSYVPQQLYFVDDTIAANIALGVSPSRRDQAKIETAARRARIHDHIASLPDGYDTPMGEHGIKLSGGQRQRIGIARALYRQPALLVLDEASNALDAQTERQVIASLLEQDLTLLIIAHRISILRGCTRIVVLEKGTVVACGSFEQLMESDGIFRGLATADLDEVSDPRTVATPKVKR